MRKRSAGEGRGRRSSRIGLFGKFGSGNIGNDASMAVMLNYLRSRHPEAQIDAMCTGPETVAARYGIDATYLQWSPREKEPGSSIWGSAHKMLGLAIDAARIGWWTRRHDAVIISGTGILETSLPLSPRAFPYSMLFLCVAGRLFGTKVALVGIGAGPVKQPTTRWVYDQIVRLSSYRSYRDLGARAALADRGLDVGGDGVYPDLAFSFPVPESGAGDRQTVGVGVMDYRGTNDERDYAEEVYTSYVDQMKAFVRWLVDEGRSVRLFVGDANGSDDVVVREILSDIRRHRPDLDPSRVVAEPVTTFADLLRVMSGVGSVVAIRFHNLIGALKLSRPTIAISYSPKHDVLMADMGVPEFCQAVATLDAASLVRQFEELELHSTEVHQILTESNAAASKLLESQFAELSEELFPGSRQVHYQLNGTGS